jgi:hypothetical protein
MATMGKVYIIMKRTFGDFDIPLNDPECASLSEETAKLICSQKNDRRSKEDLKAEVKYHVVSTKLK